jgi:hypothetical protein
MKAHPIVKQIANFCGIITMTGKNIVNAMKTRKMPLARKRPKYMRDLPDGTLLVEDWKLPGNPRTPLENLEIRMAGHHQKNLNNKS